jgi:hypothetical protein
VTGKDPWPWLVAIRMGFNNIGSPLQTTGSRTPSYHCKGTTVGGTVKKTVLHVGILTALASVALGAQGTRSPLDVPTALRLPANLPACGITTALLKLARTSDVAIGLEESADCRGKFPRLDLTVDNAAARGMTVREVLDRLVALSPDYRWSEMNGVAVVRPVASWTDPADALNLRVQSFRIDNATVRGTLALILGVPAGEQARHGVLDNRAFSIAFSGGTMIDALNTLVRARQGVGWNAGLVIHPSPSGEDRSPTLMVGIRTFRAGDRVEGEGAVAMGSPLQRLVASR